MLSLEAVVTPEEAVLQLQNTILEMIATGEPLARIMDRMCLEAEKLAPGVICSVLEIDKERTLRPLAAPSLPDSYSAELEGLEIGPNVGSCGTAAFLNEEITVTDIATDPRWEIARHLALNLGLKACWSSPIPDADGKPIATFAFYYRECRGPTEIEREIVRHCVHMAAIALDRHQRMLERERRAFTDALTGLGNRAAFNAALAQLSCDTPGNWALLILDLDNLKFVNDTFGHHTGDLLLTAAAERIAAAVAPAQVYRLGGDEFATILESPAAKDGLEATAERILSALAQPAQCDGQIVIPRATIGGAVLSSGDRVAERVRQNADFALYHAKETGRGGFVRYWPGLGTNITRRLSDIREVDAALREDRIDVFYQPGFRLKTREILGLEALCRMRIGDRFVAAAEFQEAMKDVHVATALTQRVMELVAADMRSWLDLGVCPAHVGINVSSADMHGGSLARVLAATFERENVPLKHVVLEVTESVYMGDGDRLIQKTVAAVRAAGARIALDDFGTGYASLTHLLTMPTDIIKIDKSFVDRLASSNSSFAIIEGLVQIADKLGIHVIAEGVETEAQVRQLQAAGCLLGQGYLYSRPADRHETTRLLLKQANLTSAELPARDIPQWKEAAGL